MLTPCLRRLAVCLWTRSGLDGSLESSEIRVGRARRSWAVGRALVFDDSYEVRVSR